MSTQITTKKLAAEGDLSRQNFPLTVEIYDRVAGSIITAGTTSSIA